MSSRICSYKLTSGLVHTIAAIAEAVGQLEGVNLARPNSMLRRSNRVQTVQASLAIEGNTLTPDQVTSVLDGEKVLGPEKDIIEVQNALQVYRELARFDFVSLPDLLRAHAALMQGLVEPAGRLRDRPIGILRAGDRFQEAPPWQAVPGLMQDLFDYVQSSNDHLLLKSARFHYQLEYIHPFIDGNGRMGRLWQTRLLMEYHPIFEFLPVERLIHQNRADYYRFLAEGDDTGDCTGLIGFLLTQIRIALAQLLDQTRAVTLTVSERLRQARTAFGRSRFSRKDYQNRFKTISTATASRDLQNGVKNGSLIRTGDKRTAVYHFAVASGQAEMTSQLN